MTQPNNQPIRLSDNEDINLLLGSILKDVQTFTEQQFEHIKKLNKIGVALSAEDNLEKLLEMILDNAKNFTNADAGTLYLADDDETHLMFTVVETDSLNIKMGGTMGEITWPPLPLYKEDGSENREMVAALCALEGKQINIEDVYEAEGFNFEGTKKFDAGTGYRSKSMLVIPMKDYEGTIIGVLQMLNRQDHETGEVIAFTKEDEESTLSLASQAAMAINNVKLIKGLKDLLQAFIKSIAAAIDEKSPYTGGHIRRVAEITMMIAEQMNETTEGPFADVHFDDDQLYELRTAAWMHDVGKITTPEYVVDKSTKLETIYDRIETVRTRFQAKKREVEVEYLTKKLALVEAGDKEGLAKAEEEYKAAIWELEEDLTFVETANVGGEFMADEKIERIHKIAAVTWNCNGEEKPLLSENEVYNLSIRKGTLTNEERQKINDHAMMSIKMLEALPFPKKLKHVPRWAGGHHEKINGKGYPLGLKGDELVLEARILALADIFEALTASDRPYKPAKKMSEVMKIMGFMVKDEELDPRVVQLFYDAGLHVKYARQELQAEQLDIEVPEEAEEPAEEEGEK